MMKSVRSVTTKVAAVIFGLLMLIFVLQLSGIFDRNSGQRLQHHFGRQDQRPGHRCPRLSGRGAADHRQPATANPGPPGPGADRADPQRGLGPVRRSRGHGVTVQEVRHHGRSGRDRQRHADPADPGPGALPGVPDRRSVRPRQVPALARLGRSSAVPRHARGAVSRRAPSLEAAAVGHRRRVRVRRRALAAVSRRERAGHDQPHRDPSAQRGCRLAGHGDAGRGRRVLQEAQGRRSSARRRRSSATSRCRASPMPPTRPRRWPVPSRSGRRSPAARHSPRWHSASRPTACPRRTAATWASGRRATWMRPSMPRPSPCRSNALSQPVLSQFGYHIIQVSSRTGDKAKGRHILIPIEISGTHRDRLEAQADSLDRLADQKVSPAAFADLAKAMGLDGAHHVDPAGHAGPRRQHRGARRRRLGLPGGDGYRQPGHRDRASPSTCSASTAW